MNIKKREYPPAKQMFSLRLPKPLIETVRTLSDQEGLTLTEFMTEAIEDRIKGRAPSKASRPQANTNVG